MRQATVTTTTGDGPVYLDWENGFALPSRFSTEISAEWLPYDVSLDLVATRHGGHRSVRAVGMHLAERPGGPPLSTRRARSIRLTELVRMAVEAALEPFFRRVAIPRPGHQLPPGGDLLAEELKTELGAAEVRIEIESPDSKLGERFVKPNSLGSPLYKQLTEDARREIASRPAPSRIEDDWLIETAEIYRDNPIKPTKAVQQMHSQRPISYSTAARWVGLARKRFPDLMPAPTTGRPAATKGEQR